MKTVTSDAVVFVGPGSVAVQEQPVPQPDKGQILIRTIKSMISPGTELSLLSGDSQPGSIWADATQFPAYPGYANVGEVIGVGEGGDESMIGRRVASYTPHARFVTITSDLYWPIPDGVDDESACFFVFAQIIMNAVRRSGLTWGESAVVYGLGILGQLTARICVLAGARPVFGVDVSEKRLGLAGGGVIPVNPSKEGVPAVVKESNSGRLADVLFEVTGNAELIQAEMKALRSVGRLVLVSSPRRPTIFDFHDFCNNPSFTIIGAHNWSHPESPTCLNPWTRGRHAELFFDLLKEGRLEVSSLITHRSAAHDAPLMYQILQEKGSPALGVVLEWE